MDNGNGGAVRGRLSRDLICETALEAIDEVGLDAVSMRMLAGALGVKASSLYHHFGSKDDLMTAVAEFLYRKLGRPPEGADWVEQIKGTFVHARHFVQVHPNAAPLLVRDMARSTVARYEADALLGFVCDAGADPIAGATLLSNLVALLVGHTLLALWAEEETGIGAAADGGDGNGGEASRVWLRGLFPAKQADPLHRRLPAGAAAPGHSVQSNGDSVFSAGVDALIRGFASNEG